MEGYWDEVVASWRDTRRERALRGYSDRITTALLSRWLPDLAGRRVLKTDLFDEAVGKGLYPFLRSLGATVTGVDISATVIETARRRYPDLQAEPADVRALPHADSTFDAVISNSTLDHFGSIREIETALHELRRVLARGGALVVTLDNPSNPMVALRNALPPRLLRRLGLVSFDMGVTCGHKELTGLLERSGFEVTHRDAVMHVPRLLVAGVSFATRGEEVGALSAIERLSHLPTRYRTGQFVAARAIARGESR
jgi:SAM-dependent methyltransferase